jgi:hypothetical protein
MLTYNEAKAIYDRCRDKTKGARLDGRSTRLVQHVDGFGILYHNTSVVVIHPNNTYTLNTGGYFTKTTKERINLYSPASLSQRKYIWYLGEGTAYSDGMRVNSKGEPDGFGCAPNAEQSIKIDIMLGRIDEYVAKYAKALESKQIPAPSGGDCWGCSMHDVATGKPMLGDGHLDEHLKESYLVPSLLVNALKANGYNPAYVNPWNGLTTNTSTFKRALKAYLRKALCK